MPTPAHARSHYQASFKISSENSEECYSDIIKLIKDWIIIKENKDDGLRGRWFYEGGGWTNHQNPLTLIETAAAYRGQEQVAWAIYYQEGDKALRNKRFWYSEIGLIKKSNKDIILSVKISYALNNEFIGLEPDLPETSVPKFIKTLFINRKYTITSGGSVLKNSPIRIEFGSGNLLESEIFSKDRKCPIVFVNGSYHREYFPIDVGELQTKILGKAQVYYVLDNEDIAEELRYCLGRSYMCPYRGIRIYMPKIKRENVSDSFRHRYFSRNDIVDLSSNKLFNLISASLLGRIPIQESGGLFRIDQITSLNNNITIENLKSNGATSEELCRLFENENLELKKSKDEIELLLEAADTEIRLLSREKHELETRNKNLLSFYRNKPSQYDSDSKDLMVKITNPRLPLTPEECLQGLIAMHPDRIKVLPSAWMSSAESESFKDGRELWDLLLTLARSYYDDMNSSSGGDTVARNHFGTSFAAQESEKVKSSKKLIKYRTFDDEGEDRVMLRHLKIGVKDAVTETIRVHFDWDHQSKKIIIGHCGPHLPLD